MAFNDILVRHVPAGIDYAGNRTRSPSSALDKSSVRGVCIFTGSAIITLILLQNYRLMSGCMAIDVYGDGQARDMAGETFHMNGHGRHFPAEPLRPDACFIHCLQQGLLQGSQFKLGIRASHRNAAVLSLRSCAAFSKSPPMPTPMTTGGQGFAPARCTHSSTKFLIPSTPSVGRSIRITLIFSLPAPFGMKEIFSLSPGTSSV